MSSNARLKEKEASGDERVESFEEGKRNVDDHGDEQPEGTGLEEGGNGGGGSDDGVDGGECCRGESLFEQD